MADLVWPAGLPQKVLLSDFSSSKAPNIISTDFEIGPPQTRPRGTFQKESYTCSIMCTLSQKIVFDNFFENSTLSGTQPFEFPDFYVEDAVINVKFNPSTTPSSKGVGGIWVRISFALDLQP